MKKKKVCILGDNMSYSTGNAKVIRELAQGFKKLLCYDVSHIAIGPDGIEQTKDGIKVLPIEEGGFDDRSVFKFLDKLSQYIKRDKYDYLIILGDSVNYQKRGIGNLIPNSKTKIIFWETVDSNVRLCMEQGYNMQNVRKEIYNVCNHIITTADYGKQVLEKEFVKVDKVIWEFADTKKFYPIDEKKKAEIRTEYRFREDDFIFFMVGRNIRRKNNELAFSALYPLLLENEDMKVFCLIPDFQRDDDNNLLDYIQRVLVKEHGRDLVEERQIVFCTTDGKTPVRLMEGVSDDEVVRYHQLSDAYISATSNEGFNLNFGEALAVGHPYVGIANTTLPELCKDGEFAYMAPIDFDFNVGMGFKVSTCKEETLRKQAKKCYDEWNIKYSKQNDIDELKNELTTMKYLNSKDEDKKEFEDKLQALEADKKLDRNSKIKELQPKRDILRKYIEQAMPIGKCIAEWHKFLKSIGEKEGK